MKNHCYIAIELQNDSQVHSVKFLVSVLGLFIVGICFRYELCPQKSLVVDFAWYRKHPIPEILMVLFTTDTWNFGFNVSSGRQHSVIHLMWRKADLHSTEIFTEGTILLLMIFKTCSRLLPLSYNFILVVQIEFGFIALFLILKNLFEKV